MEFFEHAEIIPFLWCISQDAGRFYTHSRSCYSNLNELLQEVSELGLGANFERVMRNVIENHTEIKVKGLVFALILFIAQ